MEENADIQEQTPINQPDVNNENPPQKAKKPNKFVKKLIKFFVVLAILVIAWIAFSLIGRVDAAKVIPDSAVIRITVPNPSRLLNSLLAHESLDDLSAVPDLASLASSVNSLKENNLLRNRFLHLALRGKLELALLSNSGSESASTNNAEGTFAAGTFAAAYDLKFLSPLLRLIPIASNFITVPNLYYTQAGSNSRFEYRLDDMTIYIGTYKNILFATDSSKVFEARLAADNEVLSFKNININNFDAGVRLSHEYINSLFGDLDPNIAAVLDNLEFDSTVEAGLSILPRKIDFYLSAPVNSEQPALSRIVESRSHAAEIAERLPASTQYSTILSAGTLEELFQASFLFMPELDETLSLANTAARLLLGVTVNDLLFSWSGNEFAVFGMEGRPHPVYAIQVTDERKRTEVFDKMFKSIVMNEDVRLNLDGTRMPRIEIPVFLQSILEKWNINLPSPYYTVYNDFIMLSESADTLLSALRAMQRNDTLPRTEAWKNIAGGKTATRGNDATAFSLYYSLDHSMPFFLRKQTAFSGYLALYRQGLIRLNFNRGVINFSFSLIPGPGNGVTLAGGYPLDLGSRVSNQIFSKDDRIFFVSGSSVFSMDIANNTMYEFPGQGRLWVVPAEGIDGAAAWIVSANGRVTLVDGNMEPHNNFPLITGLRVNAPPAAFAGRVYLSDDDGNVTAVDKNANQKKWETSFTVPLISPPSFLEIPARGRTPGANYAAAYPKSFFGEIYLLDAEGKTLPNWPASIRTDNNTGIGFGSPLVFTHNNRALTAFVCQTGELLIFDEEANFAPPSPLHLYNIFYLQPVFDGEYLWLVSEDGTLYRVSMSGEILYQNIRDLFVKEEGYIAVFDCDGDKIPEIFITGEGNALYGFTRNFRALEGFPLPVWGRPLFIEGEGSGSRGKKPEVFGIGMDYKLYRWQFR